MCSYAITDTGAHTHTFKHYSIVTKFNSKDFIAKRAQFAHQRCSDRQKGQDVGKCKEDTNRDEIESKAGFSPSGYYPRNVLHQVIPQVY